MVTFFFLSFLEQDKHVTKCSSYIETIQPARIMTKYLPSYETKPPFMVSLKRMDPISGTLRGVSQSGQTFFFLSCGEKLTQRVALIKRANVDQDLLRSKGKQYVAEDKFIHFTTGQRQIMCLRNIIFVQKKCNLVSCELRSHADNLLLNSIVIN